MRAIINGVEEEPNRCLAQPCDFPVQGVHLPAQGAQLLWRTARFAAKPFFGMKSFGFR
jgi:hypothetical protein